MLAFVTNREEYVNCRIVWLKYYVNWGGEHLIELKTSVYLYVCEKKSFSQNKICNRYVIKTRVNLNYLKSWSPMTFDLCIFSVNLIVLFFGVKCCI